MKMASRKAAGSAEISQEQYRKKLLSIWLTEVGVDDEDGEEEV